MSKTFENLNSSAINTINVEDNVVKVVYQSNIDKEYTFTCENVDEFVEQLSAELIDVELDNSKGSVGKFLHRQIKDGVLVESK